MKESEKSAPWWATLIAIAVTAIVSVIGTVWALKGGPTVPTGTPIATSVVMDTLTYIPHILLLFGVLADMFTYEGVYSIPSLIGLLSIPVNYVFKFVWAGLNTIMDMGSDLVATSSAPPPMKGGSDRPGEDKYFVGYNGCYVQGFKGLASEYSPQTLVVSATILCYYIFDLIKNRGWIAAAASIAVGGALFVGQAFAVGTCNNVGIVKGMLAALAEGAFVGGVGFSVVDTYYPNRLPSSVVSPFKTPNQRELTTGADGKLYDADGKKYTMVDGVPVLDTCGVGSGSKDSTGTTSGGPASSSSCPS